MYCIVRNSLSELLIPELMNPFLAFYFCFLTATLRGNAVIWLSFCSPLYASDTTLEIF